MFLSTVTQLQPKHWVKRPLHNTIIEYAVAGVDPLWQLGSRMMKSSGDVGVSSAIRLSKQSIQWHYDGKDKVHPAPSKRWVTVWSVKALACKPSVDTCAAIGLRTLQPEHLHLPLPVVCVTLCLPILCCCKCITIPLFLRDWLHCISGCQGVYCHALARL